FTAEARTPTSPVASTPARTPTPSAPEKVSDGPTCVVSALSGSVGTWCLNTVPATSTVPAATVTSMLARYHAFSAMAAPRLTVLSVTSLPAWSTVASTRVSVLPASYSGAAGSRSSDSAGSRGEAQEISP